MPGPREFPTDAELLEGPFDEEDGDGDIVMVTYVRLDDDGTIDFLRRRFDQDEDSDELDGADEG